MGIFGSKKFNFKSVPKPLIRTEKVAVEPALLPPKRPTLSSSSSKSGTSRAASSTTIVAARGNNSNYTTSNSTFRSSSSADERRLDGFTGSRKRKAAPRRSPSASDARVTFDTDSDPEDSVDDWEDRLDERKRRKHMRQREENDAKRRVDPNRTLRHKALAIYLPTDTPATMTGNGESKGELSFAKKKERVLPIVHAAEIVSLQKKCQPIFKGAGEDELVIELQYPGSLQRERYELVSGRDKMDVINDIKRVVKNVTDAGIYLTESQAEAFDSIIKDLERTSRDKNSDLQGFKAAVNAYNECLRALLKDGSIARNLDKRHEVPSNLVALILNQVYDRIVAPDVDRLRKYENGTDNIYGELKAPFCTHILAKELKMTSDQVFVDLGSGVGNVVLHAALEIGCESWGCENWHEPAYLGEKQVKEFKARCQLWGLAPGKVHLKEGDLRHDVDDVLKRADVILVNNKVFTSQLNDAIVHKFLDLKNGCKIVSLQNFVHPSTYNKNDIANSILDVEDREWSENWVSWTSSRGEYFISTKK